MHPVRKRRLIIILSILGGAALASVFILVALEENMNAFYTPVDIHTSNPKPDRIIRVGGLVVTGSVEREAGELAMTFVVSDGKASLPIHFEGILPDLFREGQGVIAIGKLHNISSGSETIYLQANEVLAKHDENYMSPELKAAMEEKGIHMPEADKTPYSY